MLGVWLSEWLQLGDPVLVQRRATAAELFFRLTGNPVELAERALSPGGLRRLVAELHVDQDSDAAWEALRLADPRPAASWRRLVAELNVDQDPDAVLAAWRLATQLLQMEVRRKLFIECSLLLFGCPGHHGATPIWIPPRARHGLQIDPNLSQVLRGDGDERDRIYFSVRVVTREGLARAISASGDLLAIADQFAAEHPTWGQRKLWEQWKSVPGHVRIPMKLFRKLLHH